jgi:hypothetical protein
MPAGEAPSSPAAPNPVAWDDTKENFMPLKRGRRADGLRSNSTSAGERREEQQQRL